MKITRKANDVRAQKERQQKANEGCLVCPCCGEEHTRAYYQVKNIWDRRGIDYGLTERHWAKGLFKQRHMKVDCYSCGTCGAEWESEAYERVLTDMR